MSGARRRPWLVVFVLAVAPTQLALTCGPSNPLPPEPDRCDRASSGTIDRIVIGPHDVEPFAPWEEWGGARVVLGSQGLDMFMFRVGVEGSGDLSCLDFELEVRNEATDMRVASVHERVETTATPSGYLVTDDIYTILEDSFFAAITVHVAGGGQTLDVDLARRDQSSASTLPELVLPDLGPAPAWTLDVERVHLSIEGAGHDAVVEIVFPAPLAAATTLTFESTNAPVASATPAEITLRVGERAATFSVRGGEVGSAWVIVRSSDGTARAVRVDVGFR